MDFIKKNYQVISLSCCLLVGALVFSMSYRSAKKLLIEQTSQQITIVTDVKWQLLEMKLYSLEQQLNLLSKNDLLNKLLTSGQKDALKTNEQFHEYIEGILNNQGSTSIVLIDQSGEVVYTSNPKLDKKAVPSEVYRFAQGLQDSTLTSKIILNEKEPHQFYLCNKMANTKGNFYGTLFIEVPKEFLSIELHNTISLDSLRSYLSSSQGTVDQFGKLDADECVSCKWDNDEFILFSPTKKIRDTWTLLSAYPISEIQVQHIAYVSALDGMIALIVTIIIIMSIVYGIQVVQKSKGITNADILLVQTTWNTVSEYSIKIIAGFYKHLFADAPEVKPMFRSEQAVQEKRMASMLNTIVNSVDSLEEFKASISQLAKKHVHMGVKKEYFPIVVKAIINSVEEQYGQGFTSAHKKAWYKILNQISAIMIEEMESYRVASAKNESES